MRRSTDLRVLSPIESIPRPSGRQEEKKTLPAAAAGDSGFVSRCRLPPCPSEGILTFLPFGARARGRVYGLPLPLRIDSPMSNCCSHGTLLRLGPQPSHLSSCYSHQDLHPSAAPPGLAPAAFRRRRRPPTRGASPRGRIPVARLSAIHFRG